MSFPIRSYFKNMEKSEALEADVRQRASALSHHYDRIVDCSVTIDAPHHHHHKGFRYSIGIRMSVPGDVIVISHENTDNATYEDPYVAVHDAFKRARRQLQDFARIQRGMKSDISPIQRLSLQRNWPNRRTQAQSEELVSGHR